MSGRRNGRRTMVNKTKIQVFFNSKKGFAVIITISIFLSIISLFIIYQSLDSDFNREKIADIEFRSTYVESVAVSQNNDMIIWNERNYKENKYSVFFSYTDGTGYKRLYSSSEYAYDLEFSENNNQIYFTKNGKYYQMNLDGSNIKERNNVLQYYLRISDNEYIVHYSHNVSFTLPNGNKTFMNFPNLGYYNSLTNVTVGLTDYHLDSYGQFYDMDDLQRLENNWGWILRCNDYNPNEKYIIYALWFYDGSAERRRSEEPWDKYTSGVYRVDFDGTNNKMLADANGAVRAIFSPDYSKILFQTGASSHDAPIWIMNANGSNSKQLTNTGPIRNYEGIAYFSGDGKKIIYENNVIGDNDNIWMMNLDGSEKVMLTDDETHYEILAMSPDGMDIYYSNLEPGEIWVIHYKETTSNYILMGIAIVIHLIIIAVIIGIWKRDIFKTKFGNKGSFSKKGDVG
jgi:hypothetical protein